MIRSFLKDFLAACSFLTILPLPAWEWKEPRALCPMVPVVGALLGALWAGLLALLSLWGASPLLRGAVMALAVLALTGGLHMDGLMDTCDAVFSRRDRETRLKILSDTHAGSFAVMGCAAILLLQTALFAELVSAPFTVAAALRLALVPAGSRLGMALLLNTLPFARPGGLARLFGSSRSRGLTACLALVGAALGACSLRLGARALPAVWLAAFLLWRRCCLSLFGGVTGDLLGAFAELSETAMLFALI